MKNNKVTLKLVQFLIAAVERVEQGHVSLAEQKQMGEYVIQFLTIFKHAKHAELVELAKTVLGSEWNTAPTAPSA